MKYLAIALLVLTGAATLHAASLPDIDGNRQKYRVIYINSDDNDVPTGMAIYRAADAGLINLVGIMGCADDRAKLLAPTLERAKTCLSNLPGSVLSGSAAINKIKTEIDKSTADDKLIIFNGGWYTYISKGLLASNSSKRKHCYVYQIFMSGKDMNNDWGYHESKHPSEFKAVKSSGANIIFCPTIHPCGKADRISSVGVKFNCKALDDHYSWLIKSGGSCFKRGHQQDADGVMMLIFHLNYAKSVEKNGTCYIIKDADANTSYGNYKNISAAWKAIAAGTFKPAGGGVVPVARHTIPSTDLAPQRRYLAGYDIFGRLISSSQAGTQKHAAPTVIFKKSAGKKVVRELGFSD